MKSAYRCRMEMPGQSVFRIVLPWEKDLPVKEDITVTGPFREEPLNVYLRETRGEAPGDVTEITLKNGLLMIEVVPFTNRSDFTVQIGEFKINKKDFDENTTVGFEKFEAFVEEDVCYQLYDPKAEEPRPLILFLHGGGQGGPLEGRNNTQQLLADYGPINFALDYPDVFVLAPQAVEKSFISGAFGKQTFETTKNDPVLGWSRYYLGKVCDIIRRMVREGRVDADRIYVTGLSMGGAGTIRAMSVGSDLFAACAPVCPTMMPETYNILRTMKAPVWVSTAYVDHTIYRHKYIVDAIMQLKDEGNKNAHLTIYSPEELAKYDIGIVKGMDYKGLFSANHASWVLTYHNEHGIMTWLLNQHK